MEIDHRGRLRPSALAILAFLLECCWRQRHVVALDVELKRVERPDVANSPMSDVLIVRFMASISLLVGSGKV